MYRVKRHNEQNRWNGSDMGDKKFIHKNCFWIWPVGVGEFFRVNLKEILRQLKKFGQGVETRILF